MKKEMPTKNFLSPEEKRYLEEGFRKEERLLFKEKLSEYMRIAEERPNNFQIWFGDEGGFSLRVIRRRGWTKKRKKKKS